MTLLPAALLLLTAAAPPALDVSKVQTKHATREIAANGQVPAPAGVASAKGLSPAQKSALEAVLKRFAEEVKRRDLPKSTCNPDHVRVESDGPVGIAAIGGSGTRNGVFQNFRSEVKPRKDGGLEVRAVFWSEWADTTGGCPPCPCTCDGRCAPCVACARISLIETRVAGVEGTYTIDGQGHLLTETLADLRAAKSKQRKPPPAATPKLEVKLVRAEPDIIGSAGLPTLWKMQFNRCVAQVDPRAAGSARTLRLGLDLERSGHARVKQVLPASFAARSCLLTLPPLELPLPTDTPGAALITLKLVPKSAP